ncbi:MAG: hypothetical protein ACJAW3_000783 [Lentimonas sp.]|jgi:hypothetical protein
MKKILILILLTSFASCVDKDAIEAKERQKAKHQAETSTRLNESQKNTEGLFDEM